MQTKSYAMGLHAKLLINVKTNAKTKENHKQSKNKIIYPNTKYSTIKSESNGKLLTTVRTVNGVPVTVE